jgi:hypothetical protein
MNIIGSFNYYYDYLTKIISYIMYYDKLTKTICFTDNNISFKIMYYDKLIKIMSYIVGYIIISFNHF